MEEESGLPSIALAKEGLPSVASSYVKTSEDKLAQEGVSPSSTAVTGQASSHDIHYRFSSGQAGASRVSSE